MLQVAVDDVGEGESFEQLWTKRVGEGLLEICCVPFFVYDLALGDVVQVDEGPGHVIRSVLRRSGNGVVRVAIKRSEDVEAVHPRLHDLLGRLKYLCEWLAFGYVAVSLEPGRSHRELFSGLAALGEPIQVERILV